MQKFMYVLKINNNKKHIANMFVFNFPSKSVVIIEGCYNYNLFVFKNEIKELIQKLQSDKIIQQTPFVILELTNIYGLKDFLYPLDDEDKKYKDDDLDVYEAVFRYIQIREEKFAMLKKELEG